MSEGFAFLIRMYAAASYGIGLAEGQDDKFDHAVYVTLAQECYNLFQSEDLGWATPDIIAAVLVTGTREVCEAKYSNSGLGDLISDKIEQVIRKELADCKRELTDEQQC